MPDAQHTRPRDMTDHELDAALKAAAIKRAEAPTTTRRLVIGTIIDRLLDEKAGRRHA